MFVFGWGVTGAAIATSLASVLSTAYVVFTAAKETERFGWSRRPKNDGGAPRKRARTPFEIVRVGLPQALSLLVVSLSFMFLNRVLGGFGETRLNAWIVVGRIEECVLMIGYAVGSACMFMASSAWGAGNRKALDESIDRCLKTALSVCVVVSLVAASGLRGMGKAFPALAIILVRLGLFLLLPVAALSAAGLLSIPLFFFVFAASSVGGGIVAVLSLKRNARTLPEAVSPVLS